MPANEKETFGEEFLPRTNRILAMKKQFSVSRAHKRKNVLDQVLDVINSDRRVLSTEPSDDQLDSQLNVISRSVGIDPEEVRVFCTLLAGQVNDDEPQGLSELSRNLGCSKIDTLKWLPTLMSLEKKGVIESEDRRKGLPDVNRPLDRKYWVAERVMQQIVGYDMEPIGRMEDEFHVIRYICELGCMVSRWRLTDVKYYAIAEQVLCENTQFALIALLHELEIPLMDKAILLISMQYAIQGDELGLDQVIPMVTKSIRSRATARTALLNGTSKLVEQRYVEVKLDEMGMRQVVCLATNGNALLKQLVPVVPKNTMYQEQDSALVRIIEPTEIKQQELIYDDGIATEYKRLQQLLSKGRLNGLFGQLEKKGLRKGVTVLLSGPPGTGKTEMVKQLARANGNRLMMVNMSEVKDAFVGNSEKNVRELFQKYNEELKKGENIPILLLNEADALIGKRQLNTGSNYAVTNMLNTMQTVLLQKIEDFEGILIATTNLPDAFDEAFARRFLINVHVSRPSVGARKTLWAKQFPMLAEEEWQLLAAHPLTGADIENIAIRMMHLEILENAEPSYHTLLGLISSRNTTTITPAVGFKLSA